MGKGGKKGIPHSTTLVDKKKEEKRETPDLVLHQLRLSSCRTLEITGDELAVEGGGGRREKEGTKEAKPSWWWPERRGGKKRGGKRKTQSEGGRVGDFVKGRKIESDR